MAYSPGDAVFRVNSEGNIDRGLVIEKVTYGASDDSGEGGYYLVAWHPSGRQDVVREKALQLYDRFLMPGDVVTKVVDGKGAQLGYCRRTEVFSTVQIVCSNTVVCNVNSVDLVPLEKFTRDAAICADNLLGSIRDMKTELTILFPEGSLCALPARDAVGMEDLHSERQLPCHFQPGCFYKGQRLCGSMLCFKNARWHHCTSQTRAYPMERHVQVTVDDVKIVDVSMERVVKDYQDTSVDPNEADKDTTMEDLRMHYPFFKWKRKQEEEKDTTLKGEVDRSTLGRVKGLDEFRPSKAHLGDRNYYKLKDTDDVISLDDWKCQFATECCPLQGPVDVNAASGDKGQGPSSQPRIKPDRVVLTETLATHTVAEVVWQDGTVELGIPSSELHVAHCFDSHDTYDFLPGNFVIQNTGTIMDEPPPLQYGVVTHVNRPARTASVTFFKINQTDLESEELGSQEMSVYDIREHPDFKYRLGHCVLRVANVQGTESGIGQVVDILAEGRVVVQWSCGEASACYPQELFHVAQYDTSDDAYDVPALKPPFPGRVVEKLPTFQPNPVFAPLAWQNAVPNWFQNPAVAMNPAGALPNAAPLQNQGVQPNPAIAPLAWQNAVPNWFQNPAVAMNPAGAFPNAAPLQNQGVQPNPAVAAPAWQNAVPNWFQNFFLNPAIAVNPAGALLNAAPVQNQGVQPNLVFAAPAGQNAVPNRFQNPFMNPAGALPMAAPVQNQGVQLNPAVPAPAGQNAVPNRFQNPFLNPAVVANPAGALPIAAPVQNQGVQPNPAAQNQENAQNQDAVQNQGAVQNAADVQNVEVAQDWGQGAVFDNQLDVQPIADLAGMAANAEDLANPFLGGLGFPLNPIWPPGQELFLWQQYPQMLWLKHTAQKLHEKYLELEETFAHMSSPRSASNIRKLLELYKNSGEMDRVVRGPNYFRCRCLLVLTRVIWRQGRSGLPPRLFGRLVRSLKEALKVARGPMFQEKEPSGHLLGKVAGSLEVRPICRELSSFLRIAILNRHDDLQVDFGAEQTAVNVPIDDHQAGGGEDQRTLGVISTAEALPASHNYRFTTPAFGNHYEAFISALVKDVALIRSSSLKGIRIKTFVNRMDLFSVLIEGRQSTPYEDCLFVFDIRLPTDYPESPPQCHYVSHCSDNLHPSLCWSGRVDIPLLHSRKEGGSWQPGVSSFLDVLLSLQRLVSVSEPYFDKPGLDRQDEHECENSRLYNELVVIRLVQSMGHMFQNPHCVFKQEIERHFKDNGYRFGTRLERWLELSDAWASKFPGELPTPEALKEFAQKGAQSSEGNGVFPEFPLLPASRGFHMALRKALTT